MKGKLEYFENLNGLRGIAASMVLVYHFFLVNHFFSDHLSDSYKSNIFIRLAELLQHGVSLFFVLSGFVITRILINNKNDDDYFRRFYWHRVLRILPLYYGFLFFWYFIMPFILNGTNGNIEPFRNQVPFYLYLQNFEWFTGLSQSGPGHYWSLAVEEHFYFIWPLFIFIVPVKYLKQLIIFIILLIIPIKVYFLSEGIPINKTTFTRFDEILLGTLLAYFEMSGLFKKRNLYFQNVFKIILISIIPIGLFAYFGQSFFFDLKEIVKYNLLGLLFFSIIGLLILKPKTYFLNRILESKILNYLGKISYGFYVWHMFVIKLSETYFQTQIIIIDLFMSILFTILISHISFFYFENKILMFKK